MYLLLIIFAFFKFSFFFNDTATTEIYTLSLHDALPISRALDVEAHPITGSSTVSIPSVYVAFARSARSEEHTSELQSRQYLVCRLLLEKKKNKLKKKQIKTITAYKITM